MDRLFEASIVIITLLLALAWLLKQRLDDRQQEMQATQRELKELKRGYQSMHERLSALMGVSSDALILLDEAYHIVYMNDPARALFGVRDGTGLRLDELGWAQELDPVVEQVMTHDEPIGHTLVRGERTFAARVRPLHNGADRGILIGLNEVTELQRLGRARREFVANISHELRTPVSALQLLSDTLSPETLADRALAWDLIVKMRNQVDLLRQLTDELMDLALIESGQAPIRLVEIRAMDLVDESVATLIPQMERKQIAFHAAVPKELFVLADPTAMRKVFGNLVHNAIKFTNPDGRIEIRAVPQGDNIEFAVEDTGCGIASSDLPRIFERFYKVDRARARRQGELRGTGLGLAIAKHMVEAHGGRIRAESVEGHGSTFFFTLPAASGNSNRSQADLP